MSRIIIEKNIGNIEGLCMIHPVVHRNDYMYIIETYNKRDLKRNGIDINFIQDNQSMSMKGVLRGLHVQKRFPQCKLVRVIRGAVYDVAVDLRSSSNTFKKWYGVDLTAENDKQLLIPEGFAHGFLALSDNTVLQYKVNRPWEPEYEVGIAWNDPDLGIIWPDIIGRYQGNACSKGYVLKDGTELKVSNKDQRNCRLKDIIL